MELRLDNTNIETYAVMTKETLKLLTTVIYNSIYFRMELRLDNTNIETYAVMTK
jgi:hypothetical protein